MVLSLSGVEFQMSLLLFASIVGFFISSRFRQSGVVGSILAGILLGPSVFGIIPYSETVQALASVGAIFLLFTVGLDTKLEDLLDWRAFALALAGVILPWLCGFLISLPFGFGTGESFFIGTSLTATSVAVTVQVLSDLGKMQRKEAKLILSAAIIDDVLGLFALSVAESLAGKGGLSIPFVLGKVLIAGGFIAIGLFVGKTVVSAKIGELHDWAVVHRSYEHLPFIASVFLAFSYSVIAELAGLSAIVGSFVAGISLEHLEAGSSKEGAKYFEIIFGSLFFVSLGVLVDLRKSLDPTTLLFLAALVLIALATKFAAGFSVAKLFGIGTRESLVVGAGMMPRGEIAMIIGLVGLGAGIIEQRVFSAIVLMSLLTTLVTPFAISLFYGERERRSSVKIY